MKYIIRSAESNIKKPEVEKLQEGILLHFDYTQKQINETEFDDDISLIWKYTEFWFSINSDINFIESSLNKEGYTLTDKIKNEILNL